MDNKTYEYFKQLVNGFFLPATVFIVKRNEDGSCSEIRFFVVNEVNKKSFLDTFGGGYNEETYDSDAVAKLIEGTRYDDHMPSDPKFESIVMEAAFEGKHIHTYVDTTKIYGFWTEDILFPVCPPADCPTDPDTSYCLFMYTLNKEMDTGKYSSVSPDISSFVIKACLELRSENNFLSCMETVIADIRKYTKAAGAAVLTYVKDEAKYNVIADSHIDGIQSIKEAFKIVPFSVVASWEEMLRETNAIIIKDENDMEHYNRINPDWVATMRADNVQSLCLVPFIHQNAIIGFLFIKNFDVNEVTRIKETMELVSFFLTSEVANHLFLERLEYLSNVDMLTGVFNRNCMNVNVDELSIKLEFDPRPFNVAFCDLNGLKSINDNGGHDRGDKLLVYAADVLMEVFYDDKIYRTGGDEFTIISFSSEKVFEEKIAKLREKASDPDWLYFAIGYYHDEDKGKLRLAMRYADERMYEDKDKFYEKYPDKRR